jgi:prolyl-tRNA synthetase
MDDRDERPGVKFNDAKLIGIPIKVILGRGFEAGTVELEIKGDKKDVPVADLIATIEKINRA